MNVIVSLKHQDTLQIKGLLYITYVKYDIILNQVIVHDIHGPNDLSLRYPFKF